MSHSMNARVDLDHLIKLEQLQAQLRRQFRGRVSDLRLVLVGGGIVLRGRSYTFYAKQLVQHSVMDAIEIPITANEIEVTRLHAQPTRPFPNVEDGKGVESQPAYWSARAQE